MRNLYYLIVTLPYLFCTMCTTKKQQAKPNIILFFTDDQGYADLGCYGAEDFETPNIDQIAKDGLQFTDFYVAAPTCTPSRFAIMTGCYPSRNLNSLDRPANALKNGLPIDKVDTSIYNELQRMRIRYIREKEPSAIFFDVWSGINSNEMTVGELLKQKGYKTAVYGKWDLGRARQFYPSKHGFDEYLQTPNGHDFSPSVSYPPIIKGKMFFPHLPLIENDSIIEYDPDPDFLTKRCTDKALDFIDRNHESPFFIYMPYFMPHVPLGASPEFKGKSKNGLYGDVIRELDHSVGQILDKVDQHGLTDNTLVIFISDNGPFLIYGNHGGNAEPLREGKKTNFEGGVRVPCIMKWPGVIPENKVCRTPAMTIDLLPTFAEITGATLPKHPIDGKSIYSLLKNPEEESPHEAYFFYKGGDNSHEWDNSGIIAVRSGKWKLLYPDTFPTLDGKEPGKDGVPVDYETGSIDTALFNLEADISETNNLKDEHPEIVQELSKLAEEYNEELMQNRRSVIWITDSTVNK